jgi:HAE1 family hydrophobic/amphiphilic exporter-1
MIHNATAGIAVGVKPEPGTNILEMSDRAEKVVNALNEGKLEDEKIYLDWVYDQRPYIRGAINLVRKNILIGGTLAITVLLIFLRSASSTVIVATAIPISILGTFILMNALGRNLNVVSLAGISFAVGMLVDNAIVVLENIDRHRKMGKSPFDAAYDGAREVWGAILTSTVTTVAVFLPVVFIKEEAGQLFRDIAIAITCSVTLSLFFCFRLRNPHAFQAAFHFNGRKDNPSKGHHCMARGQAHGYVYGHGQAGHKKLGNEDFNRSHVYRACRLFGLYVVTEDGVPAAGEQEPRNKHTRPATGTFLRGEKGDR